MKFCYCAVCKKPAAKRNFRGRHHHIDEDPRVDARIDFPENLQQDVATKPITSVPHESLIESINNLGSRGSLKGEQVSGAKQRPRDTTLDDSSSRKSPVTFKSDTRDSVVMSCKARGMPTDHNSKARIFIFLSCFSICDGKLRA